MATGILGKADLSATTNTTLFTVTTGLYGAFAVNFCNRNATPVSVRLALSATGTPATTEWLLYDITVPGNSALERTGLVHDGDGLVVVYSSHANVTAMAYGFEE